MDSLRPRVDQLKTVLAQQDLAALPLTQGDP
jgi:hypothetical protein